MKNGLDRHDDPEPEKPTNVVSLANARKRAKEEAAAKAKRAATIRKASEDGSRISVGQWIVGVLFMLMAIGGAYALVSPLVKGAGIAVGLGIG